MTPPHRPAVPGAVGDGPEPAVAGLAREVEALRRALSEVAETVEPLPDRVDDLAALVAQLTDVVSGLSVRRGPTPAPSWLMLPSDPDVVARVLQELCAWLHAIFLRYPDGVAALPPCWTRHPDVVEELLWLMHAWCTAYQGTGASVQLAGDWHDRQRPGVVRRIRQVAGSCSPEKHQTRSTWDQYPTGAVPVPDAEPAAVAEIAQWWGTRRDDPAPEPSTASSLADALDGNGRPR